MTEVATLLFDAVELIRAATPTPDAQTPSTLDPVKTIVDIFGTLVASGAVIIGGVWTYSRFVKDRTYRPRLEVGITGAWVNMGDSWSLHVVVNVKNVGASVVTLIHPGTDLAVNALASTVPSTVAAEWESGPELAIFTRHAWIEPGGTISEDLIALVHRGNDPIRLDVRLIWTWPGGRGNFVDVANKIVWPDNLQP